MNDFISAFHRHNFHAAYFTYKGKRYSFSGWWLLDWGDGDKFYNSIEDFFKRSVF